MSQFGSSKLRILWISVALLLAGVVIGGVRPGDGGSLLVFGAAIPMGSFSMFGDPAALFRGILSDAIYATVPATVLLTAVFPAIAATKSASLAELFRTILFGFVNGLFYSQVLLIPLWAASYRLMGNPLPGALCLADLNAVVLGFQLLLWAMALAALFRSNAGIALLLTFALKALGKYMAWGGEYLGDPDMFSVPKVVVKAMAFLGKLLPTGQVPSDPLAWSALPLSIGGPLVLLLLFRLIPGRKGKG
jgi:hypothetical protein